MIIIHQHQWHCHPTFHFNMAVNWVHYWRNSRKRKRFNQFYIWQELPISIWPTLFGSTGKVLLCFERFQACVIPGLIKFNTSPISWVSGQKVLCNELLKLPKAGEGQTWRGMHWRLICNHTLPREACVCFCTNLHNLMIIIIIICLSSLWFCQHFKSFTLECKEWH